MSAQIATKQIAPDGATTGQALVFNGTNWAPGTVNGTLSVATLAARPAVASLPDSTLVFVRSQRSWYRSDLAGLTYRREPVADPTWMAQASWALDPAGNDENTGAPGSPLLTPGELFARLPAINITITVTIAAGMALGRWTWQPVVQNGTVLPSIIVTGVRTLSANAIVATSSDETATLTPRVDAGIALPIGGLVQATSGGTSGATAAVLALIAGNNYATAPWRNAAGTRVAPPAAGQTIAIVTLPTATFWAMSVQGGTGVVSPSNLAITQLDDAYVQFETFNTCTFAVATFLSLGFYSFFGCNFLGGIIVECAPGTFFGLTGFAGAAGGPTFDDAGPAVMQNCAIAGGGFVTVRDSAYVTLQSVGIVGATADALSIVRGGHVRAIGTLYGSGNTQRGTSVLQRGTFSALATVTPTLGSVGQELILDEQVTAIPALVGGAVVPVAAALTTWAQWIANFNRSAIGLQGPAGQASGASITGS